MALDAQAVDRKRHDLEKAVKDGAPAASIALILNELKTGVVPSEKLLRDTKIGVVVNKFRSHKDPAVAKLSIEMVNTWRNAMKSSKSSASTPKPVANGTASPAPAASASPVPKEVKVEKKKYQGDVAKRNSKTDNVNTNLLGNSTRDSCLSLLYNGLAHMSSELSEDILPKAREVELATFNKFQPETSEPYKSKIRSLYQNLKSKSNPQLRVRVLSGEISAAAFVVMSSEDLKSDERRAEDEKLKKENMDKAMVAQEERSISTQLTCGKCGQKKVSYTQAQTRSADEPMTTFCTCMNCGNRWKFS